MTRKQRPMFTIFQHGGQHTGDGAIQFRHPFSGQNSELYHMRIFRHDDSVSVIISALLTVLAVVGIWEKDSQYFGH